MKHIHGVSLGALQETLATLPNPDRAAYRSGKGMFSDYSIQWWSNRAAMARSIRMQQRRESRADDWKAVLPLRETEGY